MRDGVNGYLAGDDEAMARALARLVGDGDLRAPWPRTTGSTRRSSPGMRSWPVPRLSTSVPGPWRVCGERATAGGTRIVLIGHERGQEPVVEVVLGHGEDPADVLGARGWAVVRALATESVAGDEHVLTVRFDVRRRSEPGPEAQPTPGPAAGSAGRRGSGRDTRAGGGPAATRAWCWARGRSRSPTSGSPPTRSSPAPGAC